jgi:hypothetical protein
MLYYTNNDLAWLCIPKNASTSTKRLLVQGLGWQEHDLYRPHCDPRDLTWFGILRDPDQRHSLGLLQYLASNQITELLDHPRYQTLLASAMLDEHSMPVHFVVPESIIQRAMFFVMDDPGIDLNRTLTSWLAQHGVLLPAPMPHDNASNAGALALRQRIHDIKQRYLDRHNKLTKWALARDMFLYRAFLDLHSGTA